VPPVASAGLAKLNLSSRERHAEPAGASVPDLPAAQASTPRSDAGENTKATHENAATNVTRYEVAAASTSGKSAEKRFYLELSDDVERAPSIGPKTATRLEKAGIRTVRDLLDCDPEAAAGKIGIRYITPKTILDWQRQSILVLTIPELRGTHAQLLVGAGFNSADEIAAASSDDVCSGVLEFAGTREGQRILRDGAAPDIEKIKAWAENAQHARKVA
jgi:predicted flap endonuclease-1-like 5' DNA nuclease